MNNQKDLNKTDAILEHAKRILSKYDDNYINSIEDKKPTDTFTKDDIEALKDAKKEERKQEIKEMPLKSKLSLLTEKQWSKFVERIVDELEEEEFLYQVREGFYDKEPELKERLVKGFLEKKEQNQPTRARIKPTRTRLK